MRLRIPLTFLVVLLLFAEDLIEGLVPHDIDALVTGGVNSTGTLAFLVIASGVIIRAWASGTIIKGRTVSRTGPYAIVRHPLYLGSLLIALGFATAIGDNENVFVILLFALVIYLPKIWQEEKELTGLLGEEYTAYKAEVPAIIPHRIPARLEWTWESARYMEHREYRVALAVAFFLVLIELIAEGVIPVPAVSAP